MTPAAPAGWTLTRVDHVTRESRAMVDPVTLGHDEIFHYSIPAIQELGDGKVELASDIASLKLAVTDEVVLVSKLNPDQGIVLSARPRGVVTVASSEFVALGARSVERGFLQYLFMSHGVRCDLVSRTQSATKSHRRAKPDDIRKTWFALPPRRLQEGIVDYLDSETARIDALIDRKQRFIDLLLEKRTALIAHAVTKGLDTDAEVKDSGVGWIGAIPSRWEAVRIKQVARLESGHTPSRQHPEYWVDCTVPWITTSEVWQVRDGRAEYISETNERVSELGLANSSARKLPAGTVVLSRTASVGFSAIMPAAMATSQDFADWVPGPRVTSEYLLYTFRAMRSEFDRLMMGSTHQTIYMPDIQKLEMPLPPLDEQAAIVQHIRRETSTIDSLVDKTRETIDLLREYRTALISAAVTGQIDIAGT